jgi:AmpD protein
LRWHNPVLSTIYSVPTGRGGPDRAALHQPAARRIRQLRHRAPFCNTLDWDAHPYYQSIRGLEVSAHFLIRRDGRLLQFVSTDRRAWHAGVSHYRGRHNCNDDSIGIELEGLEGQTFEAAQYTALAALCRALANTYPIAHIAGHEHVAPGRKADPGPGFDWLCLRATLGWPAPCWPDPARSASPQQPHDAATQQDSPTP